MEKVILIRYGELWLKGNNKKMFEDLLVNNIKSFLNGLEYSFHKCSGRYFIEDFDESIEEDIVEKLRCVFGLHSISVAIKVKSELNLIKDIALSIAPSSGSFRVTCKRADKTFELSSTDTAKEIGAHLVINNQSLSVDLHKPNNTIYVDIRENGYSYLYKDVILCAGGLPLGSSGKGLLLLSGGIDSPVAGYQMAKRGMNIDAIHFHSAPYTSEQAKQKVIDLAKILSNYVGNFNLYIVKFTDIQLAIHKYCDKDFMITIMRRIMVKIAREIAKQINAGALITGESLGQVASQTMQSITSTQDAVNDTLIFRPLISFDKIDTIKIANEIKTYDTSILAYEDCCTIFLPKSPVIKPKLYISRKEESKIENLDELIKNAINNVEVVRISL